MLRGFDKWGKPIGAIDFIEGQWSRKWSSCGSFVVYMAMEDYNPALKYVENVGRPEVGIVQKITPERTKEGSFMTVEGFFLHKLADFGSYRHPWTVQQSETFEDAISGYLTKTLSRKGQAFDGEPNLYDWIINSESALPGALSATIERGKASGEAIYNLLSGTGYSYYAKPINAPEGIDEEGEPIIGIDLNFVKGRDLSEKVFFGDAYGNVSNIKYVLDESAEKAFYRILQTVDSLDGWKKVNDTFTETIDGEQVSFIEVLYSYEGNRPQSIGRAFPHKVYESQVTGIDLVASNEAEIIAQMKKQAQLDMLNHYKVESIAVEVLQSRYIYLKDYDLGDVCSVYLDELKQMYKARIEEVYEVHAENRIDVEIVLGTPAKQKWKVMRV